MNNRKQPAKKNWAIDFLSVTFATVETGNDLLPIALLVTDPIIIRNYSGGLRLGKVAQLCMSRNIF